MTTTKILVVEDETPIREMIAFHLSRAGYDVVQAEDSRQARQCIMMEDPRSIRRVMNVTWAARVLVRIGDHAKNIWK
jgi:DNA-binding NtrC family response regulator